MLEAFDSPLVVVIFGIVVGWTLIETSTGIIHALVERINASMKESGKQPLSNKNNALLTVSVLLLATAFAKIGIINLIAKGYTIMAYGMIGVYALPLLTVGVYKIIKNSSKTNKPEES
jgi:uncharacterized membrane protein YkvI